MIQQQADILRALARPAAASSDFDLSPRFAGYVVPVRDAGVLVPLIERPSGVNLVLTMRAAHHDAHPGQIAFPGGKRDDADQDITQTAQREAWEEIGLAPDNVEILGHLPSHETVTGFAVTPVLGWVKSTFVPIAAQGEVAEVFRVPLGHVTNLDNYLVQSRCWRGQRRQYYTVPYGPYYIWGATACILRRIIG